MGKQDTRRRYGNSAASQIVIYGTCGFAREIYQWLRDLRRDGHAITCEGFLVDDAYRSGAGSSGLPVFGDVQAAIGIYEIIRHIAAGAHQCG